MCNQVDDCAASEVSPTEKHFVKLFDIKHFVKLKVNVFSVLCDYSQQKL